MKKRHYVLIALGMALFCFLYIAVMGRTYTAEFRAPDQKTSADDIDIVIETPGVVAVKEKKIEDGILYLTFKSIGEGKTFFYFADSDYVESGNMLYVHPLGIITFCNIIGACTGGQVLPISALVFLTLIMIGLWKQYKAGITENLYQYRNVRILGMLIFLVPVWIILVIRAFENRGLYDLLDFLLNSTTTFAYIAFPIAFISFIIVTLSNLAKCVRRNIGSHGVCQHFLSVASLRVAGKSVGH